MKIAHLNKGEVLAALYNGAKSQGMGFPHYDNKKMTATEADELLEVCGDDLYFDYLKGRVMKINLAGDEIDTRLYNRDNGDGAAEKAIAGLKSA